MLSNIYCRVLRSTSTNHFIFSLQSKLEESLQNMEQLTVKMTEDKKREKEQTKVVCFKKETVLHFHILNFS